MAEKEWSPSNVFDVFGDDLSRRILVLASERPLPADELVEMLDVSRPTVYRRVNALIEQDLVVERQQVDADGHHYKTFETTLERISFEIDDGGCNIDIRMRRSLVDQFDALWLDLEEASPEEDLTAADGAERDGTSGDIHHG